MLSIESFLQYASAQYVCEYTDIRQAYSIFSTINLQWIQYNAFTLLL